MEAPPVQYVTTIDGKNIAYTVSGAGPPLVFVPGLINHVLLSWQHPTLGAWLRTLVERFTLVRYDGRGMGMSTRGLGPDHVFDDYQIDLEAVLERVGLNRFVLCCQGSGSRIAVNYAARHPERVVALIINGPITILGIRAGQLLFRSLPEEDWEAFLHTQASAISASPQDVPRLTEIFRQSVTQEDLLARSRGISDNIDDILSQLKVPVLVLHPRHEVSQPVEASMKAAQLTRGQLVVIDGAHLGDPAQGVRAIEDFLSGLPSAAPVAPPGSAANGLSSRELEVLRLLAAGRSNAQIADELVISQNTVIRHVSNIFAKIGAANRAEATSYAHRQGLV